MNLAFWSPLGLLLIPLFQRGPGARLLDTEDAPVGAAVQNSSSCARCHSNAPTSTAMRDPHGRGIAPYDLWQSSMMANAARDPLWRAVVSAEVAATPSRRAEIEATCLSCHAPMAELIGLEEHETGSLMHVLDCDSELGELARDGVSCTVCHGMSPDGLGTEASFTAGFQLDEHRRIFGPHGDPFAMPMRMTTGFTPTQGEHILDSALCGSCHTLETEALDPDGQPVGATLLEQAPYLEWRNSVFNDERAQPGPLAASCQSCHLPTRDGQGTEIVTRIVRNPGGGDFAATGPRAPFGQHVLVGGNTLVLSMLRDHADELGVQASPDAMQATIDATRDQLQNRTANLAIEGVESGAGRLSFNVDVENLTGHKLPTAHPTRRAWLRVIVRDARGAVLFASGNTDARGRIVDEDGQPLPSELAGGPTEPHRDVVRASSEVASYRAVMADIHGAATHTLIRGASWLIDDRLLPKGWSADHPDAARTRPIGVDGDPSFGPGADRVRFEVDLGSTNGLRIEAALLYQPLSARWAAELMRWDTPEIDTFRRLYEQAELAPEVIASADWQR
ncbi:MAG: cytochrome c553 [Chlamydiales bacterium]|jgi:hypothetical protein